MPPTDFVSNSAPHVSPCVNRAKSPNVKGSAVSNGSENSDSPKVVKSADTLKGQEPWTEEEYQRIIELRGEGLRIDEIAKAIGRTKSALIVRVRRLIQEGRLGRLPFHPEYTPEEDRKILLLREAGVGTAEIAETIGRSFHSVESRFRAIRAKAARVSEKVEPDHRLPMGPRSMAPKSNHDAHASMFREAASKTGRGIDAFFREIRDTRTGQIFFIERENSRAQ